MPEYLSPGVYIEEVDAGPKPIEGVSTSTAGAVGVTARGPVAGKPVLVTSFADFQRTFGGFLAEPSGSTRTRWLDPADGGRWWTFPLSVKGFFDNGGKRLYVKRVVSSDADESSTTLGTGLLSFLARDAKDDATAVYVEHTLGVQVGDNVQILDRGAGALVPGGPFQVTAYDFARGQLTLNNQVGVPLKAGRHAVQIAAPNNATATLAFEAISPGTWGDSLRVAVAPVVGSVVNILPDPGTGNAVSTQLAADADAGDATIVVPTAGNLTDGSTVRIAGAEYVISAPNVVAPNTEFTVTPVLASRVATGTVVAQLREANPAPTDQLRVWGAQNLYRNALVELDNGIQKERRTIDSIQDEWVTLSGGNLANDYLEGHKLRVIEATVSVQHLVDGEIAAEEEFPNLRLFDDQSSAFLVRHVNDRSDLVQVAAGADYSSSNLMAFPTAITNPVGRWAPLSGGDDALGQLTSDDFVGVDGGSGQRTGIQAMEDIDEISICAAPGMWSGLVHAALIQHCEILKDRFAILDPQDGLSLEDIRAVRAGLESKYAALYYPWLRVRDPSVKRNVLVAPSAHMAGIYARVDVNRGVHKAPANEGIRGILTGPDGIAQDINQREQDMLNPSGINVLRFFPNRGDLVWGARTISSDASWKYINVRRLFLYVEESIEEGTQWVVFEPNDEPLWARVRQSITNFLTTVWRSGALQGKTTDEAFFVKCDETTMTQDDIDNGRLICVIGIAPVKPAEFVIFRIQQKTRSSEG